MKRMGDRPRRFTLLEMMVVVAVIGLMMGLVLPAVQSSRYAARRAECTNNLKQIGLALGLYNDRHQMFVPGRTFRTDAGPPPASGCDGRILSGCEDTPWSILLLPHLEQQALYNHFNVALGTQGPAYLHYPGFSANTTVFATKVGAFQCPGDRATSFQFQPRFTVNSFAGPALTRGNYAASWGNTTWDQLDLTDPPVTHKMSAFGNTTRNISMVTDGMSNTFFLAEILQGSRGDIRGVPWMSLPGAGSFMSRFTPNSRFDLARQDPLGGDELFDQTLCVSESSMPCTALTDPAKAFTGPRSQHPGGVFTLTGDGAVHFIKDTIARMIWLGANTINGEEVLSDSSY